MESLGAELTRAAPATRAAPPVEFDAYAEEYLGGTDNPVKRFVGGDFERFIAVKVGWLLKYIAEDAPASADPGGEMSLLDFGCGTGEMLQQLRRGGFRGRLEGCDVSKGMLAELVRRWDTGDLPLLHIAAVPATGLAADSFDLVLACCVFHHIDSAVRSDVFAALRDILKPGGRLVVFEHNPRNPVTRLVVSRTPIDRNAVLLDPAECRQYLSEVRLHTVRAEHFLFAPPRLRWAASVDRLLRNVPLGGQYVMVGERLR